MKKVFLLATFALSTMIAMADVLNRNVISIYPDDYFSVNSNVHYSGSGTIDADGERIYAIATFPDSKTIERVIFRTGTITTGATLQYTIETVARNTSNPFPTGTLYCANSSGTLTILSADDQVYIAGSSLAQPCAVTAGNVFAVGLIRTIGTTFNGVPLTDIGTNDFPILVSSTSASGYAAAGGGNYGILFRYTDGTFGKLHNNVFISSTNVLQIGSGSSPNEIGNYFGNMPFSGTIKGLSAMLDLDSTAIVNIWKKDALAYSVVISSGDGDAGAGTHSFYLPTPFTFSKGENLYVTFKATTTAGVGVGYGTIFSTSTFSGPSLSELATYGDRVYLSSATNATVGTDFSKSPTARSYINLMISDVDYGIPGGAFGASQ